MLKNINMYNFKKWYKMIRGKSILHVNQGVGKVYSKDRVTGYYNDFTEKVLKGDGLEKVCIPTVKSENGEDIIFPIAVFQYGLGSYDLYLTNKNKVYIDKFKLTAEWAIDNQECNGAWNTFFYIYPESPYSAMAQGEGVSLLIRAYLELGEERYLNAAKKAIDFMLKSIKEGGTTLYKESDIYFQEYTHKHTVLNGWIFALLGLYDYVKVTRDTGLQDILNKSIGSIERSLGKFDNGYWSMYNIKGMITSPFYHELHIAQLNALYDLFGIEVFKVYRDKWIEYKNNPFNRMRAFVVKVFQKLTEK